MRKSEREMFALLIEVAADLVALTPAEFAEHMNARLREMYGDLAPKVTVLPEQN